MSIRGASLFLGLFFVAGCSTEVEPDTQDPVDSAVANDAKVDADTAVGVDTKISDDGSPPLTDATGSADRAEGNVIDAARDVGVDRTVGSPDGASTADASDGASVLDTGARDVTRETAAPDAIADSGTPSCVGAVDTNFLREKLSQLSGAMPVQVGGTTVTISERNSAANRKLARQFLTAEYEALGFTVTEHSYATGVNLIASRAGADTKYLIVSAHYDSIRDTVAGADDDGSGVIAGLAVAKALQTCHLDHGLRILAFDEEEDGLLGSKAYASSLQSGGELANLIGDVQLEMLGYHTKADGGFLLVDCKSTEGDRPESKFLNDAVLSAIVRGNLALEPHDSCTSSSDHSPFWTAGAPAIVYSQEFFFSGADSTPCYHKDCDKIDQINFDYFSKLTTLSVAVAADLVGAR